ncbi:hypothetical protein [Acidocella sp.]|uniref:hypothetical protein n=1 Tax=Acidocella sp. TaxID=50710 RepID=UPI0026317740|nr:hypothetical protein [Acidocella sp.]MDD2795376.1 hypothetical protein [Acidocella sp.]
MQTAAFLEIERDLLAGAIRQQPEFTVFKGISAPLPPQAGEHPGLSDFYLRHALESAWFSARGIAPALASLAAARAAAQFIMAEAEALASAERAALPAWVHPMAADVAPGAEVLAAHFPATAAQIALIRRIWPLLGTAEGLMETGGDIRLARDPRSALNGYGCSHRPRPWAITFASSTASSSSERGYTAADRARLRATLALLRGTTSRNAVRQSLNAVRRGIAKVFGLRPDEQIILAASGTDTELLALALTHLAGAAQPILNILIAPEETGRGVPMAARGLHFAVDTALGHDVTFQAPVAGFRADTALANIPLREADGALRAAAVVEAETAAVMANAMAQGQRVILHALDLSKTGLLAPRPAFLAQMRALYGDAFDIVVDACQARLSPASVRAYLALGAVVLITGSKFFTGPPFAGAALLPAAIAARLASACLPAGLDAYFGRDDFPPRARAAANLPPVGNYGLALRWHAALAEMQALLRVAPAQRAAILEGFGQIVRAAVAAQPALSLLDTPEIHRGPQAEPWEHLHSIFTFSLRAPHAPGRCLTPAEARKVYLWLNTDLSALFPAEQQIAARICHIGQPVPLPQPGCAEPQGALRVSAGARLLSGEPSHRDLARAARLQREFADLAVVFRKIDLILRNWDRLSTANPQPCYRPARPAWAAPRRGSPVA